MKTLIIQGSARSKGHTHQMVCLLRQHWQADVVDLLHLQIGPYDYQHAHRADDFLPLLRRIGTDYELLLFATPVYWYSMSGLMKVFFDRISDCLQIEKDTGRQLRGKHMALLSCGSEPEETPGFSTPFELSADYLGMHYLGHVHTWMEDATIEPQVVERIENFVKILKVAGPPLR